MCTLLGYADRVSVAVNETINFMVSCTSSKNYNVELMRIIHGDINPDSPGFKSERIPYDFGNPITARFQPIYPGSYGLIEDHKTFKNLTSFTVQAAIYPTLPGEGSQTIISRKDPRTKQGFRLLINSHGVLEFEIFSSNGNDRKISTDNLLHKEKWYVVAGSYNADNGEMSIYQHPIKNNPNTDDIGFSSISIETNLSQSEIDSAIMIGAESANTQPAKSHFNGRIDSPRIYSRASIKEEINELLDADKQHPRYSNLIAAWDFSIGISTDLITDISPNKLHGKLVNLPTRGVPGRKWTGQEYDWKKLPEHYGAIHFHDDDLYDCGWDIDFSLTMSKEISSGVYAVRLYTNDEEFYIPFAVRPARGQPSSDVALLLPTASYAAYANHRIGIEVPETEIVTGHLIQLNESDLYLQEHPELGLCFYDLHNDGSCVYYSSRLRPIINMQPKHIDHLGGVGSDVWQFNADTHILGWLDNIGQSFDVITDEDMQAEGLKAISDYRVIITGTHPEYYSLDMLDTLQSYVDRGGRLMYLGGNGFYWRISYHQTLPGVIECRKSEDGIRTVPPPPGEFYSSFTGEYSGLWRRNGRPPNMLAGVGMASQGFDISSPYIRTDNSYDSRVEFIFKNISDKVIGDFGLSGGGAAGLELDAANIDLGTPAHALILASSQRHTDIYLMTPEDMNDPAPGLSGTESENIRSDMVFFETTNGGAVFSTGSIAWCGSLSHRNYSNNVAQITTNVLNRFIDPESF